MCPIADDKGIIFFFLPLSHVLSPAELNPRGCY